jgi:hypothetical protein
MAKTGKLRLIRDVLDKLMLDRNKVPVGRVDGIVLLVRGEHSQPRVVQIECGSATLARRLNTRLARVAHGLSRKFGCRWKRPVRIDWSKVNDVGRELMLDLDGDYSPLLSSERWLRDHIIRHIPGNGMKEQGTK